MFVRAIDILAQNVWKTIKMVKWPTGNRYIIWDKTINELVAGTNLTRWWLASYVCMLMRKKWVKELKITKKLIQELAQRWKWTHWDRYMYTWYVYDGNGNIILKMPWYTKFTDTFWKKPKNWWNYLPSAVEVKFVSPIREDLVFKRKDYESN